MRDRTDVRGTSAPIPAEAAATLPPIPEIAPPAVKSFRVWTTDFLSAKSVERAAMEEEGMVLAVEHTRKIAELIPADPRAAIANAVPMMIRQRLPARIVALLERRVQETADVEVLAVSPDSDPSEQHVRRFVKFGGRELRAFVYGRRTEHNSLTQVPVHGVAVENSMAVAESPLRVLEPGEIPPPGAERVEKCPVSGLTTAVENPVAPVTEATPAVQVGTRIVYLCEGGHIQAYEEELIAAEGGTGGTTGITAPAASSFPNGPRTLLYMRLAFPDDQQEPQTEAAAWDSIRQLNSYFQEISYGKLYYLSAVPPLIILPRSEAWYAADYIATGSNSPIMNDAKDAARRMGYNPDNYQHYTVIYTGGPGSFGGLGSVGGSNVWLKSTSLGVFAHEIGHNTGAWHGNYWTTTSNRDVIGGGANSEYGNSYDVMGSSGSVSGNKGHFMSPHKNSLGWLNNEFVSTVVTGGTYRIYPMDQTVLDPAKRYALKIAKDVDRDYWVEFRQKYNADYRWFKDGVLLNFSPWGRSDGNSTPLGSNRGGQILDTTPGSADGKNDAPVVIGRTYSDTETGIHITPVAKGGTTPESMDVVVNLVDAPGNNAPVINTLGADTLTPAVNGTVNFTVDATDPDGDTLAYFWDFGDATYGSNAAAVAKQFTTARHHAVRCIVSDMKGGETSKVMLITVGAPTTFTATGRIVDAVSAPMREVRVQNGSSGTSFRGAWTDSNGDFIVTNLAAGSVTLTPMMGGYTFAPASTAVTVGPSATAVDFTGAESVRLTIEALDDAAETGADTGLFRITRTGSTAAALTVYTDLQGDATTGDYTLAPVADATTYSPLESFSIPIGAASLDLTLTATNDSTREGPERLGIVLIPHTSYHITGKAAAFVTINDTGTSGVVNRVSVVAPDPDAHETGDPGQFEIRRSGPTTNALNVTIALAGASNTTAATNGTDYTSIATTATIPAGESSVTVDLTPTDDALVEGQETAQLTVSSSTLYGVGTPSSAIVRIADDDIPAVSITATDATATEGAGDTGLFTVTRSGDTTNPLVVDYTIGGGALHGTDYLALPGTLTIPAGAASATILITPVDDAHGEPAQTVVIQLRNDPRFLLAAANLATVTINDNDLPVVAVGVSDNTCSEPAVTGAFRITTTGSGTGNITVRYTISGTATSGADFTALSGTLSMGKNTTGTVTITPIADALLENAETVELAITPDAAYQVDVLQPSAALVIRDDDQPNTVNVSFSTVTMAENGTSKIFFSRTGSTGGAATAGALDIGYALTGTAVNGTDYALLSGTATIPDLASSVSVDITGTDDSLSEGAETMIVSITSGAYSIERGSATLTITDTETSGFARTASFEARRTVKTEGDAAFTIPVILSAADPVNPVSVDYIIDTNSATGSGLDTNLTGGTLVFAPGETQKDILATVVDDLLPEMEEHLTLKLSFANGAGLTSSGSYHTLFIRDNEPRVSITASDPVALEQTGDTAAVTISRTGPLTAALTVTLAVSGTATSGTDFTAISNTATLAVGQRTLTRTLTPLTDAVVEGAETAVITVQPSTKYSITGTGNATLNLLDSGANHPPTVRISSPLRPEIALSAGTGLILAAAAADEGAVTTQWTAQSGPGTVTFGNAAALNTTALFSAAGRYVLRCTATDGAAQTGLAEVAVVVAPGVTLWTSGDIGVTGTNATGADDVRDGWVQNQGSGSSITSTSDSFRYAHTELSGDGDILARFEGVDGAFGSSRLGVMLRESTAANARYTALTFASTSSVNWNYRTTAGGTPGASSLSVPPGPRWLRVRRAGNVFSAHHSADGIAWTQVGTSQTIALNATLRAGIAVTSGSTTRPARGLFSQVQVTGAPSNAAPQVDAGAAGVVQTALATFALDGTISDDGAPSETITPALQWSQVSGPAASSFANATLADTTVTFPQEGTYTLRLTADDGEAVSFDDVQVQFQYATLAGSPGISPSEYGPLSSSITISRNGPTEAPLEVHYTVGGTAGAGDIIALPGTVTIPASASSAPISITPVTDAIAEGDETLVLTLVDRPDYHLPVPSQFTLTLRDVPIDAWRFAQFGGDANNAAVAGDLADADYDGLETLLEYAFTTDPDHAAPTPVTLDQVTMGPNRFLRLTLTRASAPLDAFVEVQATSDLANASSWTSSGLVVEMNNATTLRVRDSVPMSASQPRFMRLKVTR